jgi:hypothetical protein
MLIALSAALSASCGISDQACTADFRYGIVVAVVHSISGAVVADSAAGIVRDVAFTDSLMNAGGGTLLGAGERAGNYEVIVRHPRYMEWRVDSIRVTEDECYVRPVLLTARLQPPS